MLVTRLSKPGTVLGRLASMVYFGRERSSPAGESAQQVGKAFLGRSAALTGFALAIGAPVILPLWMARLPGRAMLIRTVAQPPLAVMSVALVVLVGLQLMGHSIGGAQDRRRVMTRTRALLGWYVLAFAFLATGMPLLLNVVVSRPALDAQVRTVRAGQPVPVPIRIGGFPIVEVSQDCPDPGRMCFDLVDGSQLVYSETGDEVADPLGSERFLHHISGFWYWHHKMRMA